ncbi:MAG: DUF3866 family protein, partial [Micromonosporaceae bacterium]
MVIWRTGRVSRVRGRWRGALELEVDLSRRADDDPESVRALAYPALVGEAGPGDLVLLNLNALRLGLGTGGYAFVVALPERLPPDPPADTPGHMVKARYTPLQAVVLAAEDPAAPHHDALAGRGDLGGLPVVTADLHSALPAVLAGVQDARPQARVAYVMTDGGALPAWFSRTLAALTDRLAGVVTVGQAFGGDLEATNVHAGLLAARYGLGADVAVVAQGPGNLGTGSEWGFSGTAVGEAVNAAAVLGGRPVGALRISDADPRDRHHGLSHHSLTAYGRVALAGADLVLPAELPETLAMTVPDALAPLCPPHRLVRVSAAGLDAALRALPLKL